MNGKFRLQSADIYPMGGTFIIFTTLLVGTCPALCLSPNFNTCLIFLSDNCSFEDWGVDELIVEDSWRRQVGG